MPHQSTGPAKVSLELICKDITRNAQPVSACVCVCVPVLWANTNHALVGPLYLDRSLEARPSKTFAVWPSKSRSARKDYFHSSPYTFIGLWDLIGEVAVSKVAPHPSAPSAGIGSYSGWPVSLLWKSQYWPSLQASQASSHASQPGRSCQLQSYRSVFMCVCVMCGRVGVHLIDWFCCFSKWECKSCQETSSNCSINVLRWNSVDSCVLNH